MNISPERHNVKVNHYCFSLFHKLNNTLQFTLVLAQLHKYHVSQKSKYSLILR